MRSLRDRAFEDEQMDAADLAPDVYARILNELAVINRLTMGARPTLNFLQRALANRKSFRLLDVGFGQGDMLRAIARWAGRAGIDAELHGVDLNPKSAGVARASATGLPIEWITGDYRDQAGRGWDFVISSLTTHHMDHQELIDFLLFMEREARMGWIVNDLHRHRFAYASFPILARLMRWHRIVREDGQLSVARSFRPPEWRALIEEAGIDPAAAKIARRFPFRLCVERRR